MARTCVAWALVFTTALAPLPALRAQEPSECEPASEPPAVAEFPAPDASPVDTALYDTTTPVEFTTTQQGLSLHLQLDEPTSAARPGEVPHGPPLAPFGRLCVAPCIADVPTGRVALAVALHDGTPRLVPGGVEVAPGAKFEVSYRSRRRLRIAGGSILGFFVFAGLALIAGGTTSRSCAEHRCTFPAVWGTGIGLASAGLIAGPIMLTRRDSARITPLAIHF